MEDIFTGLYKDITVLNYLGGAMVRILALNVGLNDFWVKSRTLKMVFVASPLSRQYQRIRVKAVGLRIILCPEWSDKSTSELLFQ